MSAEVINGNPLTGSNKAWQLVVSEDIRIAVSDYEMVEYVIDAQLHPVPLTPAHCANLMVWRGRIVPVIDFLVLLNKPVYANASVGLAIVAYQVKPREPLEYLGLLLAQPPARLSIEDDQACELPTLENDFWGSTKLALACFSHDDLAIPIIDIAYLCSEEFRKSVAVNTINPDTGINGIDDSLEESV